MLRTLTPPVSRSLLTRVQQQWPAIVAAFEAWPVAYGLLLLLQLKRIWGVWLIRDVSGGDTTWYFATALRWYQDGAVVLAWSPLYTAFYGSFLFVNPDPVWATIAHRVAIILIASVLVLAVLRQLLPPTFAFLCAAWWVVLPIGFDTLFEVHLFSLIPVLVSWLLLATANGPWRRAAALAVLGVAAVLARNELSVAVSLLGLFLVVRELRAIRAGKQRFVGTFAAYAIAAIVGFSLIGLAYVRSDIKYPQLSAMMESKHRVNMAQVYAFGYKQRHPEWNHDHWTECYGLMQRTFGKPDPSLREMIATNPKAVREHFAWNISLTVSGLQMLLFNGCSGSSNPDYFPDSDRRLNRVLPAVLGVFVLTAWSFGLACLWRGRAWWRGGAGTSQLAWAGIVAVAAVAPLIIATQRPRPSYLFAVSVGLMALTGLCAWAAATKWNVADRVRSAVPVIAVALLLFTPSFYRAKAAHDYRPMATALERLRPYASDFANPNASAVLPAGTAGVGVYLTGQNSEFVELSVLLGRWSEGESFAECLSREKIDLVYLDEAALTQLEAKQRDASLPGWVLVAGSDTPGHRWRYFRRTPDR